MATDASHNTHTIVDRPERRSPGPWRMAWYNSQDLVRTLGVSALLHGALVGAALAYVAPAVDQPDTVQSSTATFEQVTIPAELYASIVGEPERASDSEDATSEPESASLEIETEPSPEVVANKEPTTEPEQVPASETEETIATPEPIARAVETEFESPIEPIPSEAEPAELPPELPDDTLVAEATLDAAASHDAASTAVTAPTPGASPDSSDSGSQSGAATGTSATQSPGAQVEASSGDGAVDRGLLNAHRRRLSRAMQGENQCPREAIRQRVNGVAYVGLTQDASGRVTHVSLKRSAGNDILDREALAFAQGLRRLPAPPQDIQGTEFVVPVVFRCS